MRTELPHDVIVVISVNSGAVLHASCEPCRASSLGCCSHVVAVLFSVLDYVEKQNIARNLGLNGSGGCVSYTVMALKVLKKMYGQKGIFKNISFSMR